MPERIALPAPLVFALLDEFAGPEERIWGKRVSVAVDGMVYFDVSDEVIADFRALCLDGETAAECVERMVAKLKGRLA